MKNMMFFGKRVCFLGAHPDDIEIGSGALIAQIADQTEIRCVTFSDNQKNPDLKNLVQEHYASMKVLGLSQEQIMLLDFETRRFPHFRQEILEQMISIQRDFQPDIVFVHSKADVHQDHQTLTAEALRAFRGTTILGFDVIRSSYGFFPSFLVAVSEEETNRKIEALQEYKTYASKYYFDPELTRATLLRNGAICERKYAEGFDILRVVASFGQEYQ
ncbi:PIG-L deacetylase family protein [Flexilinea flocculi]|jgi:LmbE family N-acetylglucosaminyl deacetylase|uniref:N-acetylglucosaminyl deacetylase, LmbE family n=1 Tax=Flexilinea flocculi TaxID=1678840 RepID=A0A0K8PCZ8_9CHLR|nr:PIG-L deacetylase family protein [Flexilinea flocculi]GAP40020.1 N-acetylglucosaminyl deacetylase, LmbE family [Flexilinea flocculi]